jgi:predicted membrane metal-binding protein
MSTVDLLTFGCLAMFFARRLHWKLPATAALLILASAIGIGASAAQTPSVITVSAIALPAMIASLLLLASSPTKIHPPA